MQRGENEWNFVEHELRSAASDMGIDNAAKWLYVFFYTPAWT